MGILEVFSTGVGNMFIGDLADRMGDDAVDADLKTVDSRGMSARLPGGSTGARAMDDDKVEEVLDVFLRSWCDPVLNWTSGDEG
jgi:hypothetical protein